MHRHLLRAVARPEAPVSLSHGRARARHRFGLSFCAQASPLPALLWRNDKAGSSEAAAPTISLRGLHLGPKHVEALAEALGIPPPSSRLAAALPPPMPFNTHSSWRSPHPLRCRTLPPLLPPARRVSVYSAQRCNTRSCPMPLAPSSRGSPHLSSSPPIARALRNLPEICCPPLPLFF